MKKINYTQKKKSQKAVEFKQWNCNSKITKVTLSSKANKISEKTFQWKNDKKKNSVSSKSDKFSKKTVQWKNDKKKKYSEL